VARANPSSLKDLLDIADLSRWRAEAFGKEWLELMRRI